MIKKKKKNPFRAVMAWVGDRLRLCGHANPHLHDRRLVHKTESEWMSLGIKAERNEGRKRDGSGE